MDDHKKTYTRQNLLSFDNLADVLSISKKVARSQEVDYDALNAAKAEEDDHKRLLERINDKIRF
jgi:calcium-dependent protein kinase